MIVRRDQMRASKIMQDRVMNTPNIKIYWNSVTDEILGEKNRSRKNSQYSYQRKNRSAN
jgi:thioredoxin reductase